MPKATEHIDEMVVMIKKMIAKGTAYKKNGTYYCRIANIAEYGRLACLDAEHLKQNADGRLGDSDEYEKEDVRDFALWKAYDNNDGDVFWKTELGEGRPGWHIECSAMSTKYLGEQFDIHTGGVDLIFPHHTNEIAQSESASGKKPFVKYWMHNAHLIVNGEKMSKSKGNFYTLRDLRNKGYDARAIRYELIRTHYRTQLDFREDELEKIPETLARFDEIINKLQSITTPGSVADAKQISLSHITAFEEKMDDDLNISGGIAVLFDFIKEVNTQLEQGIGKADAQAYLETLQKFDSVLGVMNFNQEEIPEEVTQLAEKRVAARNDKDWDESDRLRDLISQKGYTVLDDKEGYRLKKN